jgi:hypothetical protein
LDVTILTGEEGAACRASDAKFIYWVVIGHDGDVDMVDELLAGLLARPCPEFVLQREGKGIWEQKALGEKL